MRFKTSLGRAHRGLCLEVGRAETRARLPHGFSLKHFPRTTYTSKKKRTSVHFKRQAGYMAFMNVVAAPVWGFSGRCKVRLGDDEI